MSEDRQHNEQPTPDSWARTRPAVRMRVRGLQPNVAPDDLERELDLIRESGRLLEGTDGSVRLLSVTGNLYPSTTDIVAALAKEILNKLAADGALIPEKTPEQIRQAQAKAVGLYAQP
jgi:hypothetical protein